MTPLSVHAYRFSWIIHIPDGSRNERGQVCGFVYVGRGHYEAEAIVLSRLSSGHSIQSFIQSLLIHGFVHPRNPRSKHSY